ncbi:MAG: hypothetical protein RR342_01135 [Bacilli bacterium]
MSKLILGQSGFDQIALGYETNASQIEVRAFKVASTETSGIVPGTPVACTANTQVYKEYAASSEKFAGIALATNIKVDTVFPQSATEVKFMSGDNAGALIYGEIAVKLHGSAPAEGAPVYYDFTNKAFTATSTNNTQIPGARFMGRTNGNVTVIFVQYI